VAHILIRVIQRKPGQRALRRTGEGEVERASATGASIQHYSTPHQHANLAPRLTERAPGLHAARWKDFDAMSGYGV